MNLPQTLVLVSIAALSTTACSDKSGGQVGEETLACLVVESTSLEVGEKSPLGFAAQDFLDAVAAEHVTPMKWADGREDSLTFTMSYAGATSYQVREWNGDDSGTEIQLGCGNVLELQMTIEVSTGDDALNATWTLPLIGDSATEATLYQELEDELDHSTFAPDGTWDSTRAWLSLSLRDTGISGSIAGQTERSTGSGNDGVAEASAFDIASIGPSGS